MARRKRKKRKTYAIKEHMNSPVSIDSRLLAAKLDDLAYDGHEFANILAKIGACDAGGRRFAVHSLLFSEFVREGVVVRNWRINECGG